jgi:ankyrin repeat protein
MSKCATLQLDLDQPPPGKPTLLWIAIARRSMAVAQYLIVSGVDINLPSLCIDGEEGNRLETPMAQAILCDLCAYNDSDHFCPVDFLIMSGANVDDFVNGSMTALLAALKAENHKAAEKLLLHGADPNIRDLETRLHAFDIALAGKYWKWPPFSTLKSLIDHGFECNGEFNNEITIQEIFKGLLEQDPSDYWQPVELTKLLIDAGAEVNAPTTEETPMTALQYAIDANHEGLIDILLAAGADIHAPAFWEKGRTTLQAACNAGNFGLVRRLVARGLDINASPASHYGATALQFAAMQGHIDVAIFLLEKGALINAPAALVEGRTALQGAAEHGRLDMVFLLLENDQDDGLEERCQEAARFAEKESRFEIAQILRDYRKV